MSTIQMNQSSVIRSVKDEFVEEYEPMTSLYWRKNKKPNVDIRFSPFAIDRQLEDQKWSMSYNRNPRGSELTKGQRLRSETFVKKRDPTALSTKAKVVNKIVREVSGIHTYALIPPIEKRDKRLKEIIDPDTHPMMKPYRDESTRKPIMCSFGHRPSSASRTFHPSTMKVRLRHEEIAAVAGNGQVGFGLQPAVLAKLLHAPHLEQTTFDDDAKSLGSTRPPSGWEDPLNLFISADDVKGNLTASSMLYDDGDEGQFGGNLEHSKSWNAASYSQVGDLNNTTSFAMKGSSKYLKQKKIKKNNRLDPSGWNNHFHVIERHANESFELKKSGIAELKLMPLKDRLTRFASLSVRESRPYPFCAEKKSTDALLLAGKDAPPREVFDLKENPYYDAEVNEDVRIIQLNHEIALEDKRKSLQRKKLKAALKSIPKCTYHPDLATQNMRNISDEEIGMKKAEADLDKGEFQSVGDLYNTFSPKQESAVSMPRSKRNNMTFGSKDERIRQFALTYLGEDVSADSYIQADVVEEKKKKKGLIKPKYNIDRVFDHVMQPFEDYLRDEEDDEDDDNNDDSDENEEVQRDDVLEEEKDANRGVDITDVLREQHDQGEKIGFHEAEYDYDEMRQVCEEHDADDNVESYDEQVLVDPEKDEDCPIHSTDQIDSDIGDEENAEPDHLEGLDEFDNGGELTSSASVLQTDDMFQNSFVNQDHKSLDKEDNSDCEKYKLQEEDQNDSVLNDSMCQSPLPSDDMFQNSFVNQDYKTLDKEGVLAEGEEEALVHDENDLLDNPQVYEQPEYVEDENFEAEAFNDDLPHYNEHDEEGDHIEGEVEDDKEDYDDNKLDFANNELDDNAVFSEKY